MPEYLIQCQRNSDEIPQLDIVHMHAHESYEIYCFLKGDAKYSVEGNFYELKPGDILVMKRAEAHSLIIKSQVPYERYVINFYPEAVLGETRDQIMDFIYKRPLGKFNRFPASLFKQKNWIYYLEKMCKAEKEDEQRIYLTVLLNELKSAFPEIKKRQQKNENFSNTISFINDHITENITLEDICRYSFLSKSQLNRKFKSITGSTAWEYVTVKRLMLAKELLKKGHRPTAVFLESGFNDYSTFYRAYKTKFQISPTKDYVRENQ